MLTVATATMSAGDHLLADVLARGVDRALHVFRLHRADVEEQHDQPAAGQRLATSSARAAGASGAGGGRAGAVVLHLVFDAGQQLGRLRRAAPACR